MQKRLTSLLICLLLLATLVAAFHHHDDGADHPDCPICLAGHQQSEAGCAAPGCGMQGQPGEIACAWPVLAASAKTFLTPSNNRAPPV